MKELILIQKSLNIPKSRTNQDGGYAYRNCEDILRALKEPLSTNRCFITLSDDILAIEGRFYVRSTATITNADKETVSCVGFAREPDIQSRLNESQITGSASSYARKYALNGLFAIDDNKDADHCSEEPKDKPSRTRKTIKKQEPML